MKNDIPMGAVLLLIFAMVILLFMAIVLIMFAGPISYDMVGPNAPDWQKSFAMIGSILAGVGCGVLSAYIAKYVYS